METPTTNGTASYQTQSAPTKIKLLEKFDSVSRGAMRVFPKAPPPRDVLIVHEKVFADLKSSSCFSFSFV